LKWLENNRKKQQPIEVTCKEGFLTCSYMYLLCVIVKT